jgi:hypothetical protein
MIWDRCGMSQGTLYEECVSKYRNAVKEMLRELENYFQIVRPNLVC